MQLLFLKRLGTFFLLICALMVTIGVGAYLYRGGETIVRAESVRVERGDVQERFTMSGKAEAEHIVELTFPTTGVIQHVYREEGDRVAAGEVLASLTQDSIIHDYQAAIERIRSLEAERAELMSGPTETNRSVTQTTVSMAAAEVERIRSEQARLVVEAREALLTTDIQAYPRDASNRDVAPVITGNYLCDAEGEYVVSVYGSRALSDYSYRLSGLERGTFTAYTDAAGPLGTCGLYIQFDPDEYYSAKDWVIPIPNTRSSTYTARLNAYKLALQTQSNALAAAEEAYTLAERTGIDTNASPRSEAIAKIDAQIRAAQREAAAKEARITDYTIRAPFDGTITESSLSVGETASAANRVVIVQEGTYDFTIRIPEVDITRVHVGDTVHIAFDANPEESIRGNIEYIPPHATDLNGVAYYEARATLSEKPSWIRSGMNADVHIITTEKRDTLRLPERFIVRSAGEAFVLVRDGLDIIKTPVTLGLIGNNGYVELLNLPEHTEVFLP